MRNILTDVDSTTTIRFIVHEGRKGTNSIGFLPASCIARYQELGWINSVRHRGQLIAFCVYGIHKNGLKIYQIWTVEDGRRMTAASAAIAAAEEHAKAQKKSSANCWVAEDLESVKFWQSMGWINDGMRTGGIRRRRLHLHFSHQIKSEGDESASPPAQSELTLHTKTDLHQRLAEVKKIVLRSKEGTYAPLSFVVGPPAASRRTQQQEDA